MRIVLDTNVLIAAFISHGTCHELLEHCLNHHELVTSPFILGEFSQTLGKKFGFPSGEVREALRILSDPLIDQARRELRPVASHIRPKDMDRLERTADMIGAPRPLLRSQTTRTAGNKSSSSRDLPAFTA